VLGSGSRGNAALVESGHTCVMLDCGFSVRETTARLAHLKRTPEDIDAILVTHEHSDHAAGVAGFARRHGIPVWATAGTRAAVNGEFASVEVNEISPHAPFALGDLEIAPFPVPHDAREPAQFVFGDGDVRLGYLTDLGSSTAHVEKMLGACQALVLECNHDRAMLKNGTYPPSLKARIAGSHGHFSNDQAADLLGRLGVGWLRHIVAAHLSEQNNRPDLACAALARALDCTPDWVQVADQDQGLGWRDVVRD
jgi:phosphoribosyl 1,2-cyclic phosphodiesterase